MSHHLGYIEFPAEGLLADYKPCILAGIRHYCEKWRVPWWALSSHAAVLAHEALASYDPSKGSFATHLFHRFKRLNRVAESHLAALHGYRRRPGPTRRLRAYEKYADEQGRINWDEHRPVLIDLEQHQRQSLRLTQKAVLDWMIEPDGRTLTDVAEWNGFSKSRASKQPVQAESPQPAEASEPRSGGLSAKAQAALQTALSDPEARAAIEAPLMEAEAARARYAAATSELAGAAQAAVLAQYPELRQYPIHQLPAVLDYMSKNDPARHAAIMGSLNHAGAIMAAHKEATAEQQQIQRQQFQSWAKQQDDAFDKSLGAEISVEKKIAIQREIFSAAKESGISREQLAELWESNPVLRSAGFQKMMHDAALYRMAQRNLKSAPASRSQIPNVQKPGVAKAHGEADLAEIGDLRDQFKRASGQEQLRLAVKLHQMQRKARG